MSVDWLKPSPIVVLSLSGCNNAKRRTREKTMPSIVQPEHPHGLERFLASTMNLCQPKPMNQLASALLAITGVITHDPQTRCLTPVTCDMGCYNSNRGLNEVTPV
jgi:hypothetical protein